MHSYTDICPVLQTCGQGDFETPALHKQQSYALMDLHDFLSVSFRW